MTIQVSTNLFAPPHVFLFVLLFLHMLLIGTSFKDHHVVTVKCIESERLALLKFKAGVVDDYGRLSTWGTQEDQKDCCKWTGVHCDNRTNQVVALNLQGPHSVATESPTPLRGRISHSLLELVSLRHLDLSNNDFNTIKIPDFLGSFRKLQHLNLSRSYFIGSIPRNLGNLSTLQALDLSGNFGLSVTNADWLAGLSSLQHLDLSVINLPNVTKWLHAINKLTKLEKLNIGGCGIQESPHISSFSLINSSNSLVFLDLSFNNLNNNSILLWFLKFSSSFTHIDISHSELEGKIPDSLTNLKSLSYLDLSYNKLQGSIPYAFGNLVSLAYVDLSGNMLDGKIPDSTGDMISLSHLDLSGNNLQGGFPLRRGNLSNLVSLQLSDNKLEGDLSHMTNFLRKSTMLEYLDLYGNRFYGSIPPISRYSLLNTLSLGGNQLNGSFAESRVRLPYLVSLEASRNRLTGRLPDLSSCSSLVELALSYNNFNETVTETIGYLSKLRSLLLHSNNFVGIVTETHLSNLSNLEELHLSFNSDLTLMINPHWNPPFQLVTLELANCNLGPYFPAWLHNQRGLSTLDISNSQISDTVPAWFWNNSHSLNSLNMSHNHIYGGIPDFSVYALQTLDLSSNEFNGSLPVMSSVPGYFDLSRNRLSGPIANSCNFTPGRFLDLSDNQLFGELSGDCFKNLMTVDSLNLASNNLSGEIPNTVGAFCYFSSLHLRNNSFRGQLPISLRDCYDMKILDLGHNHFSGEIPSWIGENLLHLGVLSLRSNEFHGSVPTNLCHLTNLTVLDLSVNKISGTIPRCLSNFTSMSSKPNASEYDRFLFLDRASPSFYGSAYIMWKGQDAEYVSTLGMVKVVDMSSNNLVGNIPPEITTLEGLIALNLSRNNLVGSIPRYIVKLEFLNFLDLSENNLSGSIPDTLSQLSHLGVLNLSNNNLSGRIPWSTHLQTFDSSAYMGNTGLCGSPLLKTCPGDQMPGQNPEVTSNVTGAMDLFDQEDKFITRGFYVSMAIGFIIAFWGIFGSLTFIKSCNVQFSKLCTVLKDWLYVKIAVNKNRLLGHFQNE